MNSVGHIFNHFVAITLKGFDPVNTDTFIDLLIDHIEELFKLPTSAPLSLPVRVLQVPEDIAYSFERCGTHLFALNKMTNRKYHAYTYSST